MRQLLIILILSITISVTIQTVQAQSDNAQQYKISELFKAMPDSLMPLLTTNNRLDMIDFMDAGMKARVTNLLNGESEMTCLTADSLTIRMSGSMDVSLYLQPTSETIDGYKQIICMKSIYRIASTKDPDESFHYFSVNWRPIDKEKVKIKE